MNGRNDGQRWPLTSPQAPDQANSSNLAFDQWRRSANMEGITMVKFLTTATPGRQSNEGCFGFLGCCNRVERKPRHGPVSR
jgi:hypothetical protein